MGCVFDTMKDCKEEDCVEAWWVLSNFINIYTMNKTSWINTNRLRETHLKYEDECLIFDKINKQRICSSKRQKADLQAVSHVKQKDDL